MTGRAAALAAFVVAACSSARAPRLSACESAPTAARAATVPSLLADPVFAVTPWDSGDRSGSCLSAAPWGDTGWGVEAASFFDAAGREGGDRTIDGARLAVSGGAAQFSASDASGRWAFARFIQGDVWGGTSCGPVSWNRFAPIPVANQELRLDFDVCLQGGTLDSIVGGWILVGVNVWVSAPTMPERGRDRHGRKPLVLDLMVHHRTSMIGTRDGSHDNDLAYHYQVAVAEAPPGRWTHVSIDLARELRAAVEHFGLQGAWDDLTIEQVELVAEVHHASAAARVDDVSLLRRQVSASRQ